MRKPSDSTTREYAPPIRAGYHEYLNYGYIPADQDTTLQWWVWGPVSTTLEYCLADWCISRIAASLGNHEDAIEFERQSKFYRNLFDSSTTLLRPRLRNGSWLTPFDPLATEGSGNWGGSGGPGYVEGNVWNCTWFVPHDIIGLTKLFGGMHACADSLMQSFTNYQFTITNEPDLGYPYLFTQLEGYERQTVPLVYRIMKDNFGTGPGGLPGNDDAGTISAWYVFSALGLYPALPASGEYQKGFPLFTKATNALNRRYYSGKSFTIVRKGEPGIRPAIHSIDSNGKHVTTWSVKQRSITSGGKLILTVEETNDKDH